jgi:hypothetical protein
MSRPYTRIRDSKQPGIAWIAIALWHLDEADASVDDNAS